MGLAKHRALDEGAGFDRMATPLREFSNAADGRARRSQTHYLVFTEPVLYFSKITWLTA